MYLPRYIYAAYPLRNELFYLFLVHSYVLYFSAVIIYRYWWLILFTNRSYPEPTSSLHTPVRIYYVENATWSTVVNNCFFSTPPPPPLPRIRSAGRGSFSRRVYKYDFIPAGVYRTIITYYYDIAYGMACGRAIKTVRVCRVPPRAYTLRGCSLRFFELLRR